jgi:hypothetical protein
MRELLKLFIPGVVGGIIGGCLAPSLQHKFAQWREREARTLASKAAKEDRKRKFLGFLFQWRTKVSLAPAGAPPGAQGGTFGQVEYVIQTYRSELPVFRSQIVICRRAIGTTNSARPFLKRLTRLLVLSNIPDLQRSLRFIHTIP